MSSRFEFTQYRNYAQAKALNFVVCDPEGILDQSRLPELNESKAWLAQHTNPRKLRGRLENALKSANVFIGVSGPDRLSSKDLKRMAPRPIVFALANPTPEIMPEEAGKAAYIMATGRSDYPNQINDVLAFPGIIVRGDPITATKNSETRRVPILPDMENLLLRMKGRLGSFGKEPILRAVRGSMRLHLFVDYSLPREFPCLREAKRCSTVGGCHAWAAASGFPAEVWVAPLQVVVPRLVVPAGGRRTRFRTFH